MEGKVMAKKYAMFKPVKTLADVTPDGIPQCFHCDESFPTTAKAEIQGEKIVVTCPACGCLTPFRIG